MSTTLVIALLNHHLLAWSSTSSGPPRRQKVNGQESVRVESVHALRDAFEDVCERLRGDGHVLAAVHWLVDEAGRALWLEDASGQRWSLPAPGPEGAAPPPWQLLSWEWLSARFGLALDQGAVGSDFIEGTLLPWLIARDDAEERRQMQQALAREHQAESERLAAERQLLLRENERLEAQNQALRQIDAERLVSYLPALFPRVFTVLGAADLALLCGRVEPLPIPNPYPEPSEETLRVLQRDFRALPHEVQRQIVGFVARLPQRHKLTPRPEMRALIQELERD